MRRDRAAAPGNGARVVRDPGGSGKETILCVGGARAHFNPRKVGEAELLEVYRVAL